MTWVSTPASASTLSAHAAVRAVISPVSGYKFVGLVSTARYRKFPPRPRLVRVLSPVQLVLPGQVTRVGRVVSTAPEQGPRQHPTLVKAKVAVTGGPLGPRRGPQCRFVRQDDGESVHCRRDCEPLQASDVEDEVPPGQVCGRVVSELILLGEVTYGAHPTPCPVLELDGCLRLRANCQEIQVLTLVQLPRLAAWCE